MAVDFEEKWRQAMSAYQSAIAEYERASLRLRHALTRSSSNLATEIAKSERAHTTVLHLRRVTLDLLRTHARH